jgi:flagellar biosynthesis chaperone FliJ
MSPLEVRFEEVSGKASIIVTANLAEGWRPLGEQFGFYGFAHEKYLENGLITVRVWVTERAAQTARAQDSFPLDLQSMGSSPSRALAFRLFNGRLSLGAALSTVINSRRSDGKPGHYREAVLVAQYAGVSYWLRFYAALNDEHPEMPEWTELDSPLAEDETLPRVSEVPELSASILEDRLSSVSRALDSLEERATALAREFPAQPFRGPAASPGNGEPTGEGPERTVANLREQWSKEFEKQSEAALEKLREEITNSGRGFEEIREQLASMSEAKLASLNQVAASVVAGLEAASEKLREEIRHSERVFDDNRQQLASLAETKMASLNQVAADALAGLGAAAEKLREEIRHSGRAFEENKQQLATLAEAKVALLNQVASNAVANVEAGQGRVRSPYGTFRDETTQLFSQPSAKHPPAFDRHQVFPKWRGVAAMLTVAAGLLLVVSFLPLRTQRSFPPPADMRLQVEPPPDFVDDSPYWSAKRRAKEEETAQAYWRVAVLKLQREYPFGSQLPVDPPLDFQADNQPVPMRLSGPMAETRAHYWDKLRACWGQTQFWVKSQVKDETWAARLRRIWE